MFVWGKILETIGAILVAYVAVRAGLYEIRIGRHFISRKRPGRPAQPAGTAQTAGTDDLDVLVERLRQAYEHRRRQFGLIEAIAIGLGTLLIAVGCGLYLYGLLSEH